MFFGVQTEKREMTNSEIPQRQKLMTLFQSESHFENLPYLETRDSSLNIVAAYRTGCDVGEGEN
jgi:hypothetical protein